MTAPSKFYVIVPTVEEIASYGQPLVLTPLITQEAAEAECVRQAIVSGKRRCVLTLTAYADATLATGAITAQINAVE